MANSNTKSEIVSVSLPSSLARETAKIAKENMVAKSRLFQEALREYLCLKKWKGLQTYGVKRAIDLGITPDRTQNLIDEYRREKTKGRR